MFSVSSRSRVVIWSVWAIASVFYAYQYVLRVMPNIMLTDIMDRFHISAAAFGQFSGVYYIGYSLMHLPAGIMLDRFGPKRVMSGCILMTVLGLVPLIFADHWVYPVLGRVLIGIGSSAAILGIFKIIRMMFSEAWFSRMLSFSVMIGLIGAIYGGGPVSYMRNVFGYETVIQLFALSGIILALITYWMIPHETTPPQGTIWSDVKEVLTNWRVLWICFSAGLMVGPLEGFADVWGTAFLKQVFGFEGVVAASLPSTIFVGMCFGAPLLSILAEKCKNYLAVIIGCGFLMLLAFSSLLFFVFTPTITTLSFIFVGVACGYQILAIYKASTYVRSQVAGLTTALANMIIMMFGYIFHSIMGNVIHWMGGPHHPHALILGVSVIPVALLLGLGGFVGLLMREKDYVVSVKNPNSASTIE